MRKILPFCLAASLLACTAFAQIYVEPFTGYQWDANNTGTSFKQINSGVQFAFKHRHSNEFILGLQRSWPLSHVSYDSAFTANPSFPVYKPAQKTILPGSFALYAGDRIQLAGKQSANRLFLLLNAGFTLQNIKVSYEYDKNNYTVLNPDQTQERFSIFAGGGLEYMRLLKYGRLFCQLNIFSHPAGGRIKYPSTFKFFAPMNFNVGYSILIKKRLQ